MTLTPSNSNNTQQAQHQVYVQTNCCRMTHNHTLHTHPIVYHRHVNCCTLVLVVAFWSFLAGLYQTLWCWVNGFHLPRTAWRVAAPHSHLQQALPCWIRLFEIFIRANQHKQHISSSAHVYCGWQVSAGMRSNPQKPLLAASLAPHLAV